MPFHIRDPETDRLARELARRRGSGLTEAVRTALANELRRETEKVPLAERVKELQDEIARWPKTGLKADKEFFDDLSGDL
jgi:antitoxin VapB